MLGPTISKESARFQKKKLFRRDSLGQPFAFLPSDGFPVFLALPCGLEGWPSVTTVPRPLCPVASDYFQLMEGAGRKLQGGRRWEAQVFLPLSLCFGLCLWQWLHFHGSSSCLTVHPLWSQLAPRPRKVVASCIANLWVAFCSPFALSTLPTPWQPVPSVKIPFLNYLKRILFFWLDIEWYIHSNKTFSSEER